MKFPNKVINYNESIISKFPNILLLLKDKRYTIISLYEKTKNYFEDINEFIETLDCLFALNKIKIDEESRSVESC